jgi:cell division protein FtsW
MTVSAPPAAGETPMLPATARRDRALTEPVVLFLVVLALMTIGILMVYSASRKAYVAGDTWYFTKHLMFVPIAIGAMVLASWMPYGRLNRRWIALSVFGATVAFLAAVLVFGIERGGARRWFEISIGSLRLSLQPSEFAKLGLVLFLAWFFGQPRDDPQHTASRSRLLGWFKRRLLADPRSLLKGFLPAMLAIGAVCVLIVKEDFGTAALVGLVATALALIAGWRWWFPLLVAVPGALGFYFTVVQVPFRMERLKVWLDPWQYIDGAGWHICQSLMGIGSGGVAGTGLGAGTQKLYIPENTTDFIFAVICEEMGVLGGLLVLGLFGVFVWRAGRVVRSAPDRFGFLLASGILLVIGLQACLNMGVVTGALPAKGISLPFISYGGSGLVMMSFAAGLLISVARASAVARSSQPLVYVPPARQDAAVRVQTAPVSLQNECAGAPETEDRGRCGSPGGVAPAEEAKDEAGDA